MVATKGERKREIELNILKGKEFDCSPRRRNSVEKDFVLVNGSIPSLSAD
jgi:hypothetical protein